MLKLLRGGRRTAAIWWLVILGTAVTFIIGFSVAPNIVGSREVRGSTVLGTVNGEPITQAELQNSYNNLAQGFVSEYGRDPAEREQSLLREQAWLQLVTEKAMLQQARRLGFRASDAEVLFAVRNAPPPTVRLQPAFQTNGQFDPQKYFAALSDPQINWSPLEDEVRRSLPGQKLEERLLASAKFSEPELRRAFLDEYEQVKVTVARWPPSMAPVDTTRFTEKVLRDYYDAHPGRFSGPAQANAVVVVLSKRFTPDDERATQDRARSLVERARAGADFAQLARDNSEGPTADQGGDMGRDFRLADLPPEITAAAATVTDSAVLEPVREGTKYYVVQLRRSAVQGPEPAYRMRQIVLGIRISDIALQEDLQRLEKMRREARKRGLGPVAAAGGVAARETGWIASNAFVPDLFTLPQAQQFAVTAPEGAVSPIYDRESDWVLLQVKERHEEGLRDFEDVRQQVKAMVGQEQRLETARRAATQVLSAVRAGRPFEEAARAGGAVVVEATDFFSRAQPSPQLLGNNLAVGVAFGLPIGQYGGPVAASGGVMLLRKDALRPAPVAAYDSLKAQLSRGLLQSRQNRTFTAWVDWLRGQSDVEDRRAEVLVVQ